MSRTAQSAQLRSRPAIRPLSTRIAALRRRLVDSLELRVFPLPPPVCVSVRFGRRRRRRRLCCVATPPVVSPTFFHIPDPRPNCAQQKAISETWSALSRVFQPKPSATLPREITRHSVVRVAFGQQRVHPANAPRNASPFRIIISQVQVWYDSHLLLSLFLPSPV